MFRCKLLPFRCALDKLLLSIMSISKSFNCLLTSSIVNFPAAVSDLKIGFDKIIFAFGNFWDMNDLSYNMWLTILDELQEEASFVPTYKRDTKLHNTSGSWKMIMDDWFYVTLGWNVWRNCSLCLQKHVNFKLEEPICF